MSVMATRGLADLALPINRYSMLTTSRQKIKDNQLAEQLWMMKKPDCKVELRFRLEGEEGVDQGAVKKEVFTLMAGALLEDSACFTNHESSVLFYFKPLVTDLIALKKLRAYGFALGLVFLNSIKVDWVMSTRLQQKNWISGPVIGYVYWLVKTRLHDFFSNL